MLIAATAFAHTQNAQPADFIFTNGKVYTVDKDNSWAEAAAVRNNKIVYVGDRTGSRQNSQA